MIIMKHNNNSDILPINRKYMPEPRNKDFSETISNILQCAVCLELPSPIEFYQCKWSHLLCATCALRLLSDALKSSKKAKCPSCRCSITYEKMTKYNNSLVMKIMLELPKICSQCNEQCTLRTIDNHMLNECKERLMNCTYRRIGCNWTGTYKEFEEHKETCEYPHKNACDIICNILRIRRNEKSTLDAFMFLSLKNSESLHFRDVKLRPRYCVQLKRFFLETYPFNAFQESWIIQAQATNKISDAEVQLNLKYRLILISKPETKLIVAYYLMQSLREKLEMKTEMHRFTFSDTTMQTGYKEINFINSNASNIVLAKKSTAVRIGMFLN